jgi:hypothetical protein
MSYRAQSKPTQKMGTTTNQNKIDKIVKKRPSGDQLMEEYAHKKNKTMGTRMVFASNPTPSRGCVKKT